MQSRLKKGSTISDVSARAFNRLLDIQGDPVGSKAINGRGSQRFVSVVAKNNCTYTLQPGSPVILGTFTGEGSGWGNSRNGWLNVHPCYLPINVTEANELASSLFNVGVVVGDSIEANACGDVAISGTVEIKCDSGAGFLLPRVKTASYQDSAAVSNGFGFARKIADLGNGFALCDLNCLSNFLTYTLTQNRQAPPNATNAQLSLGPNAFVVDSYGCAALQLIGDQGVAMWLGNRFVITVPWCIE